jgi:RHS repeat-associated protein
MLRLGGDKVVKPSLGILPWDVTKSIRGFFLALLMAVSLPAITGVANAQAAQSTPAPSAEGVDGNGVDLVSGMLDLGKDEITVGSTDDGLSRNLRFYSREDNNRVVIQSFTPDPESNFQSYEYVSIGRTAAVFLQSGSTYSCVDGSGATLTLDTTAHVFTLLTKDGAIYHFANQPGGSTVYAGALDWTRPDGFKANYYYDSLGRLQSVRNSAGYGLFYTYSSNNDLSRVSAVNLSKQYCPPAPTDCTPVDAGKGRIFTYSVTSSSSSDTIPGNPPGQHSAQLVDYTSASSLNRSTLYRLRTDVTQYTSTDFFTPQSWTIQQQQLIVTKPLGGVSTYLFGANISNSLGAGDIANRIISVTDKGLTANYTWQYTGLHSPHISGAYITYPGGGSRTVVISPIAPWARRITSQTLSLSPDPSRTTGYEYDSSARITKVTQPEGDYFGYLYDGRGNITTVTHTPKPGSTLSPTTTTYGYSTSCSNPATCNKPNYIIDANLKQTDFTYDPVHGGVLTATGPAGLSGIRPQTRYTYQQFSPQLMGSGGTQAAGAPVWKVAAVSTCQTLTSCAGTSDEVITTYAYDANLQRVSETQSVGDHSMSRTSARTFDGVGNVIASDGPQPGSADTTRFVYDADRELTATMSPDPDGAGSLGVLATRSTFDSDGNETLVESGSASDQSDAALGAMNVNQSTGRTYDLFDRRALEIVSSAGNTVSLGQYSYDSAGRLECAASRMNPAVFSTISSVSACTLGTPGSFGNDRIIHSLYNSLGEVLKVQKAYGVTVTNGFATTLQQDYQTYAYTPNGKVAYVIDANGNKSAYGYDGFDRQVLWAFPSTTAPGAASTTDYEAYTYDSIGNRTSLRKRDGRTITYTYDGLNRVVTKTVPDGGCPVSPPQPEICTNVLGSATRDVYYKYDLRGLQTEAHFDSWSGADAVINGYDGFGRLTSTATSMGGVSRTIGHTYDPGDNRTQTTWPDTLYVTYHSDGLDRLDWIYEGASSILAAVGYYNHGARYFVSRISGLNSVYYLDTSMRLAAIAHDFAGTAKDVTLAYTGYNPAGQITQKIRDNDLYAFSNYATASQTYVANGLNQYSSVAGTALGYEANGNLVSNGGTSFAYDVENRLVTASGTLSTTMVYDPLGRLFQTSGTSGTKQFLYDGDELAAEYDGSGTMTARYVHGTGEDDPMVWYAGATMGSSTRRFLHEDQQGSIIGVSDAAGNNIAINSYDEYGVPGSGNIGTFQYTGQAYLPDLGMYYYKARIYSARLGRFLQTDPIGYKDQMDLYAYVHNDPIDGRDPSGQCDAYSWCQVLGQGEALQVKPLGYHDIYHGIRMPTVAEINAARAKGVRLALQLERRILTAGGAGTRNWTPRQIAQIISGKTPTDAKGRAIEGHHINTVKGNPIAEAENPNNVKFLTHDEHVEVHRLNGGTRVPISGQPTIDRTGMVVAAEAEAAEEAEARVFFRAAQGMGLTALSEVIEEQ